MTTYQNKQDKIKQAKEEEQRDQWRNGAQEDGTASYLTVSNLQENTIISGFQQSRIEYDKHARKMHKTVTCYITLFGIFYCSPGRRKAD